MLRLVLTALSGFLLATTGSAGATLLVYEPFAYDVDTELDDTPATGQNLTGTYSALGSSAPFILQIASPGLTYGNLTGAPSVSGNRISDIAGVTAAGATVAIDQDVVVNPGDAIFWSALFTFDDSSNGNRLANITLTDDTTGDLIRFGESAVGVQAVRVEASTGATGGLRAAGADGSFGNGETLLLLGRYFNSAAPDGDTLELIGYDTADAHALPTDFDLADANAEFAFSLFDLDIDLTRISSMSFTIRGDSNNFIDELRIGSTYASVALAAAAVPVPAPATASLLLLGLLGLGVPRAFSGQSRRSA